MWYIIIFRNEILRISFNNTGFIYIVFLPSFENKAQKKYSNTPYWLYCTNMYYKRFPFFLHRSWDIISSPKVIIFIFFVFHKSFTKKFHRVAKTTYYLSYNAVLPKIGLGLYLKFGMLVTHMPNWTQKTFVAKQSFHQWTSSFSNCFSNIDLFFCSWKNMNRVTINMEFYKCKIDLQFVQNTVYWESIFFYKTEIQ